MLDAHLAKQPYLVGKDADARRLRGRGAAVLRQGGGVPLGPYANLRGWFDRVSALPCWRETAPQFPPRRREVTSRRVR